MRVSITSHTAVQQDSHEEPGIEEQAVEDAGGKSEGPADEQDAEEEEEEGSGEEGAASEEEGHADDEGKACIYSMARTILEAHSTKHSFLARFCILSTQEYRSLAGILLLAILDSCLL